jgi:hypothetical protein
MELWHIEVVLDTDTEPDGARQIFLGLRETAVLPILVPTDFFQASATSSTIQRDMCDDSQMRLVGCRSGGAM